MSEIQLGIYRLNKDLPLPKFMTKEAACFDLYVSEKTTLMPRVGTLVKAGVCFDTPKGYAVLIYLRSSMCKKGIVGSTGVIDSDFRGEIRVQAMNLTDEPIELDVGQRIGQARLVKLPNIELFEVAKETDMRTTERGVNGWGSTGA